MPAMWSFAITALAIQQASASSIVNILAAKGASCAAACAGTTTHSFCIGLTGPHTPLGMFDLAQSASVLPCTQIKPADLAAPARKYLPARDVDGVCFFNPDPTDHNSEYGLCAELDAAHSRFCTCSDAAATWHLAARGKNCLESCEARGSLCAEDPAVYPKDQSTMTLIAGRTGQKCDGIFDMAAAVPAPTIKSGAPYLEGDDDRDAIYKNRCIFAANAATTSFCTAHVGKAARRFCPCFGV
jgi:hypothetical protein